MTTRRYRVGPDHGYPAPTVVKLSEGHAARLGLGDGDVSDLTTTADAVTRPATPPPDPPPGMVAVGGPCPGSDLVLGVIPGEPTHTRCPSCLESVPVDAAGRVSRHALTAGSTIAVVAETDDVGRPVTVVRAESRTAAQQWSERLWRRIS